MHAIVRLRATGLAAALAAMLLVVVLSGACAGGGPQPTERADGPLHHYQLARVYFEQGRIDNALEQIEISLEKDDTLPQTHFFKGYVFYNLERWEEAEPAFRKALEIHPNYTDARSFLADTLSRLGRHEEALTELAGALKDPSYPNPEKIHLNRAMVFKRLGRLSEAVESLQAAVAESPRYYRAHYEMARLYEEIRRPEDALRAFEAAEPGFRDNAEFQLNYGAALLRAGRTGEAEMHLRRVRALSPGSEEDERARRLLEVLG